ncbi:DUF2750 domain-containing protein [Vibrio sp.]|uniref:DUF2750 domain-containing protein n=1 Tax=Vibrio sp. TaxID=678 RepID=UPI003AA924D8
MTKVLSDERVQEILSFDSEKRFTYCIKEVVANRQIWILVDEDGCVMLNTEDEDCVPVWPNEEFAQAWANDDWENCKPEAISLNKWHSRWTTGLEDDELSVVVFPNAEQEGVIVFPDEFDFELKKQAQKR